MMDWHQNHLIVEMILRKLELADLKSASMICKTWLEASAKAFEATSRVVICDPQPGDEPNFEQVLERFHLRRFTDFKLQLGANGAAPKGLLADLPLEVSSSMTSLILDYTPTADTLKAINIFLSQLTTKFPALEELHICPNADPTHDLVSPSAEFLENTSVPDTEHFNLKVLRAPLGPDLGSGIDWHFLRSLKNLKELDLLKLYVGGGIDLHLQEQLADFGKYFPTEEVQISKLQIHLKTRCTPLTPYIRGRDEEERNFFTSLFGPMKPETCTLYVEAEEIEKDDSPCSALRLGPYWKIVRSLLSPTLKRINIHYSMSLTSFLGRSSLLEASTDIQAHIYALVSSSGLRHLKRPEHNAHALVHIDIFDEEGGPPMSFIELECSHFGDPLVLRHGPVGDHEEHFQSVLRILLNIWSAEDQSGNNRWPVPNYNALRKYTFDEDGEIVEKKQFYPGEKSTPDVIVSSLGCYPLPYPLIYRRNGPGHRAWRETSFLRFPHSSSIVTAQPSWKELLLERPRSEIQLMPTSGLQIYSID